MEHTKIMRLYRKANIAYKRGSYKKALFYQKIIRFFFSAEIPASAEIGEGVDFLHGGLGCVIHAKCKIGKNTKIYQNVTIGGLKNGGVPTIGNDVIIGAGAVILGGITIGDCCKIGANAVVLHDVPKGSTVVGIPAKLKK